MTIFCNHLLLEPYAAGPRREAAATAALEGFKVKEAGKCIKVKEAGKKSQLNLRVH